MSVTPADFLNVAEHIESTGTDESCFRSVISRAYYAAYHRSVEVFPATKYNGGGMHKEYISSLLNNPLGSLPRKIGVTLKFLYDKRLLADYDLQLDIKLTDAKMQIASGKQLFKLLK